METEHISNLPPLVSPNIEIAETDVLSPASLHALPSIEPMSTPPVEVDDGLIQGPSQQTEKTRRHSAPLTLPLSAIETMPTSPVEVDDGLIQGPGQQTEKTRRHSAPLTLPFSAIETMPTSPPQFNGGPSQGLVQQIKTPKECLFNEPLSEQFHYPEMENALRALIDRTISVVEYGSQVLYRYGYAEVLILVEWVVPDEQMSLASQVLLDNDYPRFHEKRLLWEKTSGWDAQCLMHSLDSQGWMRVNLLPLSLVGFTLEETVTVPSTFAHDLHLFTPEPAHFMSSLIRHLLQLPIRHGSRTRIEKDLMAFISAYILKDGPANKTLWEHIHDTESDQDYQKRVEEGVKFMKTWDWSKTEGRYLGIAECLVRDCHYVGMLTDVRKSRHALS